MTRALPTIDLPEGWLRLAEAARVAGVSEWRIRHAAADAGIALVRCTAAVGADGRLSPGSCVPRSLLETIPRPTPAAAARRRALAAQTYTVKATGALLGVGESVVGTMLTMGQLEYIMVGPARQPLRSAVDALRAAAALRGDALAETIPFGGEGAPLEDRRARRLACAVCDYYEIGWVFMDSDVRAPLMVEARSVLMALLSEAQAIYAEAGATPGPRYGATQIGRYLGRDHSTVLHHIGRWEAGTWPDAAKTARSDIRAALVTEIRADRARRLDAREKAAARQRLNALLAQRGAGGRQERAS